MPLQNICGGINCIKLLDVVRDAHSKTPSLIFEWVNNIDFHTLYPTFNDRVRGTSGAVAWRVRVLYD